jgi:pyruvate/2-oxoglutarate dehydrogenase complex dihydrolipoamide acyltransferase (E2) component
MRPDEVGHLFERFYRTEAAKLQQVQGTGLGLSISKAIVEAHGGTISAHSELGTGTSLTVELPAASGPAPNTSPAPAQAENQAPKVPKARSRPPWSHINPSRLARSRSQRSGSETPTRQPVIETRRRARNGLGYRVR